MRKIISLFFFTFATFGAHKSIQMDALPYSKRIIEKIKSGHIFIKSDVKNFKDTKQQSFDFTSSGLHTKSCRFALRKLSLYENYQDYLDFVSESTYNSEKKFLRLVLKTPILPIKMTLAFKFPRISQPGVYHFQFDKGFLSGLKGQIHLSSYKKLCFFHGTATWKGPDTGYSATLFEFFTATLARMAADRLLHISATY